jgi:two-component system, OmpR family, response regulator QseB
MRILLMEDNPALSDDLKVGLGLLGFAVHVVTSCADGRHTYASQTARQRIN